MHEGHAAWRVRGTGLGLLGANGSEVPQDTTVNPAVQRFRVQDSRKMSLNKTLKLVKTVKTGLLALLLEIQFPFSFPLSPDNPNITLMLYPNGYLYPIVGGQVFPSSSRGDCKDDIGVFSFGFGAGLRLGVMVMRQPCKRMRACRAAPGISIEWRSGCACCSFAFHL